MQDQGSFGLWMKQRRKALDLTQEELAQQVGCSSINIRKIEANQRRPSKQVAILLARQLSIAPEDHERFLRFARGATQDGFDIQEISRPPKEEGIGRQSSNGHARQIPQTVPSARTLLIGREGDLQVILNRLSQPGARLITLTGPPGVGKTRLALEVVQWAREFFSSEVGFIELAHLQRADQVGWAIAQGLGLMGSGSQNYTDQIATFLFGRRFLLVLDNFEHVLNAAIVVSDLIKACPQLYILTTSRERLRLYGEYEYPIEPLALPEEVPVVGNSNGYRLEQVSESPAVKLFLQRAQAVQPGFRLTTENAYQVAEVCNHLDGLPLAIELASARMRMYSINALLAQLNDRLRFMARGTRDLMVRQHTLRDAINWSERLLDSNEQRLFVQLGVFVGSFNLNAVRSIFNSDGADELLLSLVDKSLVQVVSRPGIDEPRFMLLETIRDYALDQLHASGEMEPIQARHAVYFLELVGHAETQMRGPNAAEWLNRLDAEYSNIRASLGWALRGGNLDAGRKAASELFFYWFRRSTFSEARHWLETALSCGTHRERTPVQARLLESAGALGFFISDGAQVIPRLDESIALWQELSNRHGQASACFWRYTFVKSREEEKYIDDSIRLFRQEGDKWWLAMALWVHGAFAVSRGIEAPGAEGLFECEKLFREVGDPYGISLALQSLGRVHFLAGNLHATRQCFFESLKLKEAFGDRWSLAQVTLDIGDLEHYEAETPEDFERAAAWIEKALALRRQQGIEHIEYQYNLHRLGQISVQLKEPQRARDLFCECLKLCSERNTDIRWVATFLFGPSELAMSMGALRHAVILLGAIKALLPGFPLPIDRLSAKRLGPMLDAALLAMGNEVFVNAWNLGQQMTVEEAVALACADPLNHSTP